MVVHTYTVLTAPNRVRVCVAEHPPAEAFDVSGPREGAGEVTEALRLAFERARDDRGFEIENPEDDPVASNLDVPSTPAAYAIRCWATRQARVGASRDPVRVLKRARNALRSQGFHDDALQAAWNDHGERAFSFEIRDPLPKGVRVAEHARDTRAAILASGFQITNEE